MRIQYEKRRSISTNREQRKQIHLLKLVMEWISVGMVPVKLLSYSHNPSVEMTLEKYMSLQFFQWRKSPLPLTHTQFSQTPNLGRNGSCQHIVIQIQVSCRIGMEHGHEWVLYPVIGVIVADTYTQWCLLIQSRTEWFPTNDYDAESAPLYNSQGTKAWVPTDD